MLMIYSRGSTLIEILIVTVIVATVLTAIAGLVTQSLKQSSENEQKTIATSLAQEGLEMFRRYRSNLGWRAFQSTTSGGTYCLNVIPATTQEFDTLATGDCGEEVITGTVFTREAEVTSDASQVMVTVVVTWGTETNDQVSIDQVLRDID